MGNAARDPDVLPIPGNEKLTWGDQIISRTKGTHMQTDPATGEVYNPRRRWMEERIQYRKDEEKAASK